jgi:hypothetical protein
VTPEAADFVERWHDFYLLAGTASVTLAGLLFVALSIHIGELTLMIRASICSVCRATP